MGKKFTQHHKQTLKQIKINEKTYSFKWISHNIKLNKWLSVGVDKSWMYHWFIAKFSVWKVPEMFESKKKKIIPTYKIVNEYVSSNCYLAYKTDDDVYYCPQYT